MQRYFPLCNRVFQSISAYIICHRLQTTSINAVPISLLSTSPNSPPITLLLYLVSFISIRTALSRSLELDPFTLEIEPLGLEVAPPGGPTWLDTATEISIEELFKVLPWPLDPLLTQAHSIEASSSSDDMAEDLVVNNIS
jgi:hypothetical protein